MKKNTRLRRLVVGDTTWHWTVRQRSRVAYDHCHLKLSLYPDGPRGRRLVLLFSPAENRAVSNCYFDSGALVRLSDHTYLNLHEPGTVRRLLDAAAPNLALHPTIRTIELDGWPYFDAITADANTADANTDPNTGLTEAWASTHPSGPPLGPENDQRPAPLTGNEPL